uniref:Uncharacterized protein n=1 Tax=Candidatus Kentrum sp. MB TaxID=2138164 RepID=A0A450XFV8_9GAMM|nr:MAG: hypothetical protein BECKMB1821G_GA0114241_103313 [Candidatus Kentron sp. MB]VFK32921.1 MAG: hypothetical protein BECKMB1821I_GA0114274_103812 [Candidatus Kentron sp. MB]
MKNRYLIFLLALLLSIFTGVNAKNNNIAVITNSITKVCDKPENAGSYWDIRVKSDGDAAIKFKSVDLDAVGEVDFSKVEWDGIRKTIEDSKDYRACARELTPLFIERFKPVIEEQKTKKSSKRTLGGVKLQQFGAGVSVTLDACEKKAGAVTCHFTTRAGDADAEFIIYDGSAMYDQAGHKFNSNYASIANFHGALGSITGELIKGLDTKVSIRFGNVRPEAVAVSKVMIISKVEMNGSYKWVTFEFRNVKIRLDME